MQDNVCLGDCQVLFCGCNIIFLKLLFIQSPDRNMKGTSRKRIRNLTKGKAACTLFLSPFHIINIAKTKDGLSFSVDSSAARALLNLSILFSSITEILTEI